jgi:hypothetical protein
MPSYLGCCSQRDGAQTFRDKTGGLRRLHTLDNNPHNKSMIVQPYSNTLIFILRYSAHSNCSTRQLLHSSSYTRLQQYTWRVHATSPYLAKYKQILSYRKLMTDLTVHATVRQKRKRKKTVSLNHTATISINCTTACMYVRVYVCMSLVYKAFVKMSDPLRSFQWPEAEASFF